MDLLNFVNFFPYLYRKYILCGNKPDGKIGLISLTVCGHWQLGVNNGQNDDRIGLLNDIMSSSFPSTNGTWQLSLQAYLIAQIVPFLWNFSWDVESLPSSAYWSLHMQFKWLPLTWWDGILPRHCISLYLLIYIVFILRILVGLWCYGSVALLPHSKKAPGSSPDWGRRPFCVGFQIQNPTIQNAACNRGEFETLNCQ